jgi:hypothetical protein
MKKLTTDEKEYYWFDSCPTLSASLIIYHADKWRRSILSFLHSKSITFESPSMGSRRKKSEFDRIGFWMSMEIVHSCFEALMPAIKMHGGQFVQGGILHIQVHTLRLAYIWSSVRS